MSPWKMNGGAGSPFSILLMAHASRMTQGEVRQAYLKPNKDQAKGFLLFLEIRVKKINFLKIKEKF